MKKVSVVIILLFMVAVTFSLSTGQALAEKEKKILLKVPMAYPSALPGLGTTIIWMAERIELLSNNTKNQDIRAGHTGSAL
jgi:hypothetical protein